MKKNQGMTLVELMVVICIICILATVVLNVGKGVVLKSQIQSTQSTILALSNACEQYHALYYCYPLVNKDAPNNSDANGRLHFALEVYSPGTTEMDIQEDPVLTQNLPKELNQNNINYSWYIDAWSNKLYVCYGRDHTNDTPKGSNNKSTIDGYPNSTPLDIMSAGPDEKIDGKIDNIVSWMLNINKALRNTRD